MSKDTLPTYAIVELLIRLADFNASIGAYKDHIPHEFGVMVKTTNGHINFSRQLILQQFNNPALIDEPQLKEVALLFKAA
ncbi:hypothetical protein [Mucilaginibacter aquatilis]|uniref:Uncharacterized protein n=1 Tax=Mucilaginibacter aquatilis TaxID=1517760 RepID=A0A6I4I3K3_9SPHI|nr:hypothetical protein [Mucilaginibacter aquatilis]MVN89705.1 hypothetical protein [Mucilaginibacter aquatilis]